jgi:DNA polymerase II large subunit
MDYFETLRKELDRAHAAASEARCKGFDPSDKVEILVAKDVAARVEGLVGPVGIAEVIRKMEAGGQSRTAIAFDLAGRIAAGEFSKGTPQKLMEQAVRTSVGLLTEGVLVAPTEGITELSINENPDGTDYVSLHFAGPIRSAGGTVAALSVVFADIARKKCGIGNYRPTETEVARYVEEVNVYENRCNHLQYKPPDEHVAHIVRNCPVCIDGDPTEDVEVSVHRDLDRVKSNRVRGGIPLVLCEGIAQKAPKVLKQASKYGLDWNWLQDIIKVKTKEDRVEVKPDFTYLEGLVAGRPVFSYPMAKGGFRLRYGRSRTNGIMARNIHPATMVLLDSFPANGTHMKVERPGKGCIVTVCDSIEPPVVRLKNGSVARVRSAQEAHSIHPDVEKILFLGDMLVTFGDFLKSNHPLMPSGYCKEWWEAELEAADLPVPQFHCAQDAFDFSRKNSIPLHPGYTYPWHDLTHDEMSSLAHYLSRGTPTWEGNHLREFLLPLDKEKYILESLYVEHKVDGQNILLSGDDAFALLSSLGLLMGQKLDSSSFSIDPNTDVMENICRLSGITVRRKCPTYVGARMGRPEKAKERIMPGSPNILFPTGSPKNRSLVKLYKSLKGREKERGINVEIARFRCTGCGKPTFSTRCHSCGALATTELVCHKCGAVTKEKEHCGMPTQAYDYRPLELISIMEKVRNGLGFMPPDLKGVKGLFSDSRIPERLEKGFFRAKHSVYVYKDGTSRFDATDVPLTHFRISEINQTVEGIKALGYTQDSEGKPITSDAQVVALMAQDILVSRHGMEYISRIANFIDDTLVNLYGLHPFYKLRNEKDLIGHMVVGLSPHTSACVLARIIGYTDANVGYAHPYFHTAKRRNCFHGDEKILVHDGSKSSIVKLRELVESHLFGETEKDDFGTEYNKVNGISTFAFNKETRKFELANITHVSRHPAPKKLLRITTKSGRNIIVTPDHPFPSSNGEKVMANNVTEVLIPQNVESFDGGVFSDEVVEKKPVDCHEEYVYNLTVATHHTLVCSGIVTFQCDGDEDAIMLLLDALLNFSRSYLSSKRGGTMDAPLLLTPMINPLEVDDEVHGMEVVSKYPLDFYQACEKLSFPGDIKLATVKDLLGKPEQYGDLRFMFDTTSLNEGPMVTNYITLDSIPEKIEAEFRLHSLIRAVDSKDAAERLILSHFIPDIYGNLRSFSRQSFRCVDCNEIFRRPPLIGKCSKCGGKIILTINKGGIEKYLKVSMRMIDEYGLPFYLKQRLQLVEKEIDSVFRDEKVEQKGLSDFM